MTQVHLISVPVNSTLIAGVGYQANSALLYLEFRDGTRYRYSGVPVEIYQGLLSAPSKGVYFNHRIRGSFQHALLRRSD